MDVLLNAIIELDNGNRAYRTVVVDEFIEHPKGLIMCRRAFGKSITKGWTRYVMLEDYTIEDFEAYNDTNVLIRYAENKRCKLYDKEDITILVLTPYTDNPYA